MIERGSLLSFLCAALLGGVAFFSAALAQENDLAAPPDNNDPIVSPQGDVSQCTTFSDALSAAYHGDPRIEGARGELDRALANLQAARAQSRPQISGFVQAGSGTGRLLNNQSDNLSAIQYNQTIFTFGAIKYSKLAARAEIRAANANIGRVASEVAQEIGSAYLELLRAEALLKLAEQQEEFYAQNTATADSRLEAQVITISEASQIKANYALARSKRIDTDLARQQARARLESLIGYPLYCVSSLAADFYFADTEQYIGEITLDELLEESTRLAPEVQRGVARVAAAEALKKQVARGNLPSVSISGFASREYIPESQRGPAFLNPPSYSDRNRIGISINQNFYRGGRGKAELRDAQGRLRIAESELATIRRSIEDMVRRSWVRVQAQEAARQALAEARHQLSVQMEQAQLEYAFGVRRLDEVIRAADAYFNTASQEVETQYQYYNNLFILRANTLGVVEYRVTP